MDDVPSKRVECWVFVALDEGAHFFYDGKVDVLVVDQ